MGDGSNYAKLDALLVAWKGSEVGWACVVGEGTADGIAHVVAEGSYARHLVGGGFHGEAVVVDGAWASTPAFTVDSDGWVYLVDFFTDDVHGLYVVYAHEVEAETVDVVFFYPVSYALYHELAHERTLRGCLVAAA